MNVTVKKNSETDVELTITISWNEFKPKTDTVVNRLSNNAKIPGFRKGKVPRSVLENHYSKENIFVSAIEDNIQQFVAEALKQKNLQIIFAGKTDIKKMPKKDGDSLIILASMEVAPSFVLPDFKNLSVKVKAISVSQSEINAKIELLQKQFGTLEPKKIQKGSKEDIKAENGDFIQIDLSAFQNGKKIEENNGISYEIGNREIIPGINNAIIGTKEGEEKEFETILIGGKYANQNAKVKVKIHKIKTQILPDLDLKFVKMASEFNTIDQLKKSLKEKIIIEKTNIQKEDAKQLLMEKLIDTLVIPVPEKLLQSRLKNLIDKKTKDDEKKKIIDTEKRRIIDSFIIEKLIKVTKVEVKQEEVFSYFEKMGQMYGMTGQQMMQQAYQSQMLNDVINGFSGNKALDKIIKDVSVFDTNGKKIIFSF